ncbi:hypothetical protein [Streptomyces sp. 891-h]|nr:hypothetical protein [Streptomyces sp. 891-h]
MGEKVRQGEYDGCHHRDQGDHRGLAQRRAHARPVPGRWTK